MKNLDILWDISVKVLLNFYSITLQILWIIGIQKIINNSSFSLPQTWGKKRKCVCVIEGHGFSSVLFQLCFPFLSLVSDGHLFPVCISYWLFEPPSGCNIYGVRGTRRSTERLPSGARTHSADCCVPHLSCSFLSPSLSIWKRLGIEKGSVTPDTPFSNRGLPHTVPFILVP